MKTTFYLLCSNKIARKTITTTIATLFSISAALGMCGGEYHPFSPESILVYSVNATPTAESGVRVGGAAGIDQGEHGDCWFESAVAALARYPAGTRLLSDMITEEGGVYRVKFLDEPTTRWKVTQQDITQNHIKDNAPWADILEAAMMKRYPQMQTGGNVDHTFVSVIGEATSVMGLSMLTGHQATSQKLKEISTEQLEELLERDMRLAIPTTASTRSSIPNQAVVQDHCYSVLGYNPQSQIITVRNPWGNNRNSTYPNLPKAGTTSFGVTDLGNGVQQMSITTFSKYYVLLTWSRCFHL
jgi:Calpain family cysteine protease